MKILLIFALSITRIHTASFSDVVLEEWETFKLTYQKHYQTPSEDQHRLRLYMENVLTIAKHNQLYQKGLVSFKMKSNKWADLSPDEYHGLVSCFNQSTDRKDDATTNIYPAHVKFPDRVDWREEGAVTEVKDQDGCGACWAFSSTGALEGQNFRKTGKLVSLSEQNLLDCATHNGCTGSDMNTAFRYVTNNDGIDTEETYPYEAAESTCRYEPNNKGATCRGYSNVASGDENELKVAVATVGPVSVAIDSAHSSFQFYSEGVYYEPNCSSEDLHHAVLAVGYGTEEDGQEYWLVKNSWGPHWGDRGYVKMARNKNNNCGIASLASYPLL